MFCKAAAALSESVNSLTEALPNATILLTDKATPMATAKFLAPLVSLFNEESASFAPLSLYSETISMPIVMRLIQICHFLL